MSQENVEVVRHLYRAMNARDTAAFADLAHPALEWGSDERVGETPVRGRVIRWFSDLTEMFTDVRTETERVMETDDQVLVFVRVIGSGRGSGAGFDIRIAHLWTLRTASWCAARATATATRPSKPPGCGCRPDTRYAIPRG